MTTGPSNHRALLQRALATIDEMQARLDASARAQRQPIAIVGVGCRLPGGASTPEQFWELLRQGRDAVTEVPADRWDVDAYYDPDPDAPGKSYTRWGAFLDNLDGFDPQFFGNAPREAIGMDPQHRLLLEVAWESLERAGYAPPSLAGSRTGVFVGLAAMDYAYLQMRHGELADLDLYFGTGTSHSIAAGRLAYTFDFRGPAVAIDTACSSSLVAIHLACQSLRVGECDMAIGGGVNVMLGPEASVATSRGRMMSFAGRCQTFDAAADGYVRAEGCGLVVLKRLADAVRDRDTIVGVIHGTALNQDGRSNGLTAPNPQAQEQVVRAALADAGMSPAEIGYVEAHGTGTPLGDPIEMRALGAVFGASHTSERPLLVGSVKTNIGHLESAAGIAGLLKVLLALQHGAIPPHLHLHNPNPYIPWGELPVSVPTALTPWPAPESGVRVAGLSSFGFSGTNAHLIVGAPPAVPPPVQTSAGRRLHVLPLSAKSAGALERLAAAFEERLAAAAPGEFADISFTAGAGRAQFPERLALVAESAAEARTRLAAFRQGDAAGVVRGSYHQADPQAVVLLFTGQGAQYAGMGRELYRAEPVFAAALDRCAAIADPLLDRPLFSVLFPEAGGEGLVDDTLYTQPALFALEYALAQLWLSWGVRPAAVLGHSLGEYVAACIAGVFDLESALTLVVARARLMHDLPRNGAMAAVMAPADVVARELAGTRVAIAAVNGPSAVVISGPDAEVAAVTTRLAASGLTAKRLPVSHAFHSALMEPMLARFEEVLRSVRFAPPAIDVIANVSGALAGPEITTPDYWLTHVRQPVQFSRSMQTAESLGYRCFLELGPAPVLLGMGAQCVSAGDGVWVASMRRGQDEERQLLSALATLFARGVPVDWQGVDRPWARRKVALPTYPFERNRYWLALSKHEPRRTVPADAHPLLGGRLRSPKLGAIVFQAELSSEAPSFVSEHLIFDRVVLPATAYLEMAVSAGTRVLGGAVTITDVSIREPLVFGTGRHVVQTVLEPAADREYALEIHSAAEGSDDWHLHVSARVRLRDTVAASAEEHVAGARQPMDAARFYASLEPAGVRYGERFRLLDRIEMADGLATATLRLPQGERLSDYAAHPAIVDAALQLAGAALLGRAPDQENRPIYLPVAAGRFDVLGPVSGELRAVARVTPAPGGDETFLGDITILSGQTPVVRVENLSFKRATADALRRAVRRDEASPVYGVAWEPLQPARRAALRRSWLVMADASGLATALATRLRASGDAVTLVPFDGDEVDRLVVTLSAAPGVTDIVHCRSLDIAAPSGGDDSFADMRARGASSLAAVVQAIARVPALKPRLTAITRGAMPAGSHEPAPEQAALWGLGRTARNEHPALQCKLIDLPAGETDDRTVERLVDELLDADRHEGQIALRAGGRLAPRLVRAGSDSSGSGLLTVPDSPDMGLAIAQRGVLDNLGLEPLQVDAPRAGEIQIEVAASGLNFRDVLSALGMYPGEPGPLGGEVVGRVAAVGSGVRDFAVGDEAMALTPRGFCSRVNTSALLAWKRPAAMSVAEAATIPVAFQTAFYALHHIAGLRKGERILIHAGAGGVGLAAIQVAQAAGAEIFATAGTAAKRDLLRSLGVPHVMDSRSLAFAGEVRAATAGEGIDIVLNSLAGDFVPRSLELLRSGGRFVELGKTDLWDQQRAAAVNPNARYTAIYLGEVCLSNPALVHEMFERIMAMFESGAYRPLATRTFAIDEAHLAFRYMAQARHVGKVVVEHHRAAERPLIRQDGAYVVTGGLGGVGLHMARWIAGAGARRLLLAGRSAPSGAAAAAIDAIRQAGTEVLIASGDVSKRADVERMLAEAASGGVPVRGIVHAAGVLDDGVILQQSDARFARVYAPKVAGGWRLAEAARELDLDFLVFCSAGAALFGAPGQGNYAAANTFLDALAWQARARGVPATSVNWGAWRDTGMMAGVSAKDQARWAAQGMGQLDPLTAVAALESSLRQGVTQVAVLDMDWRRVGAATEAASPFLAKVVSVAAAATREPKLAAPAAGGVRREIEALPPEDRLERLASHVREQVRRVLGLSDSAAVRPDRGFGQLGMDSLMSVELSNRLRESLDCQLPSTLAFEHPTPAALTDYLATLVLPAGASAAKPDAAAADDESERARVKLLDDVGRMRDDEVERSLADELDRAGY